MKTKLRKLVFLVLFMTVIAPIVVLYTDTLGGYFNSSSSNTEFVEAVSTFTLAGDVTPLNVLPQESSTDLKEPFGLVYSKISANSEGSNASTGGSALITKQLTGDLAEDGVSNSSSLSSNGSNKQSLGENSVERVSDKWHNDGKEMAKEESRETESIEDFKSMTDRNYAKKEVSLLPSHGVPGTVADNVKRRHPQRSSRASGKNSGEEVMVKTEKLNEHAGFPDARIHQLKDQLVQARIYLSLPMTRNNNHFTRELRLHMKEVQKALGQATKDSELTRNASEKSKALEQTLLKGKQMVDDCAVVAKKLRATLQSAEEQLRIHRKQALFLSHLTTTTLPKGLHCLPLRLSIDYFMLNSSQQHFSNRENLEDLKLYHYALFSDNVLAAAVVVTSTIIHAKDPSKHVFHVVTDKLNYAAMRMWFLANPPPGKATIQVQNVEEFTWLNSIYSPVLKQLSSASMIDYYFKNRRADSDPNLKYRNPKYLSMMNHLRFYLPEIFPKLDKILFLDDDIVVQKDLTGLWSLDPKGKVIGVVETCGESFHRFDRYLNFSNPLISKSFSPRACGWAFGMNIVDLDAWRKNNITEVYHKWQNINRDRQLWKLGTLPAGLITFWNHTHPLDKSWHVLGLGYDPNVPQKDIDRAAVIHYNGNLKPWLEIGIPKFRSYWSKYVDYDQVYLRECNITP